MKKGFTLIELLIVVAIIAILAAIAVPNFLEAQTRAKVSRVKSDQRTLLTGFESYKVDTNKYPVCPVISGLSGINAPDVVRMKVSLASDGSQIFDGYWPTYVTTPVAYLTSLPKDPFPTKIWDTTGLAGGPGTLNNGGAVRNYFVWIFTGGRDGLGLTAVRQQIYYTITSPGPDHSMELGFEWGSNGMAADATYDPTNGTISRGNVLRFGPE